MPNEASILTKLQEWLLVNGAEFAINVIGAAIILLVGLVIIRAVCAALDASMKKSARVSELLRQFLVNVVNKLMWVLVGMVALQRLGVNIAPLIAGLGVTGFIVGFAFQETLGNLAAGFMIALNRPFRVGDWVDAAGINGIVQEMNMMATTLTTLDNKKVVVPNKGIWGTPITNYTALDKRRVDLTAGISYGSNIRQAKEVLTRAVLAHPLVLKDPPPEIEVLEMAASSVNLVVRPWCKPADYWTVFFGVNQVIKETLDREGISIPFPQMDVHHYGLAPQLSASGKS